nr:MAG TPA: Prokaryotic membrane lipoprotein lipid attachment site [Caudoviricetes sp.]
MKKFLICLLSVFMLTGCGGGKEQSDIPSGTVKYEMLLNHGSKFVYTFQDPITGVWYLSTSEGITPRLNADGSFYLKSETGE